MENIIEYRRHILNSQNPLYRDYQGPDIPRYYSNFFGSWEPEVTLSVDCDTKPQLYPPRFPIIDENISLCEKHNKIIVYENNKTFIILLLIILLIGIVKFIL